MNISGGAGSTQTGNKGKECKASWEADGDGWDGSVQLRAQRIHKLLARGPVSACLPPSSVKWGLTPPRTWSQESYLLCSSSVPQQARGHHCCYPTGSAMSGRFSVPHKPSLPENSQPGNMLRIRGVVPDEAGSFTSTCCADTALHFNHGWLCLKWSSTAWAGCPGQGGAWLDVPFRQRQHFPRYGYKAEPPLPPPRAAVACAPAGGGRGHAAVLRNSSLTHRGMSPEKLQRGKR